MTVEKATIWLRQTTICCFSQLASSAHDIMSGLIRANESGTSAFVARPYARREPHMHDSRTIANRFLQLAAQRDTGLTPMQLLKLVYIAHGWMLGLYGKPLIRDEVQAWQYGPVIPPLYNSVRAFRSMPVSAPLAALPEGLTDDEVDLIDQVDRIYGKMSGPQLSRLTHAMGTPWYRTYRDGVFGIPIPNDIIEDHYKKLAEQRVAKAAG